MEYICQRDYYYIINKYHDQALPFNPHKRFIRRDEIFDPATGMDADAVIAGIWAQDDETLSHPVRKAKAFAYVLQNTRISCDKRDIFPAIHMVDRPLNRTLINRWKKEVFTDILPQVEEIRARMLTEGIATIRPTLTTVCRCGSGSSRWAFPACCRKANLPKIGIPT